MEWIDKEIIEYLNWIYPDEKVKKYNILQLNKKLDRYIDNRMLDIVRGEIKRLSVLGVELNQIVDMNCCGYELAMAAMEENKYD